ncbi:MAG: 50S ribosomal protein L3 [Planctomycetota bacterium]|nr:MAG: 50S ribosomal protein L3 [Planctomycetota bacterium]
MIPAILGKKVGMTRIFEESGKCVPVTVVQAGPCVVMQVKSADERDGYHAVQLGFDDQKPHRSTKPEIGHARRAQTAPKRFVREIRLDGPSDKAVGDTITVELFSEADVKWVDVVGTSKGKGFQGGMRRWGFGGQPASHGVERKHRSPGSIGGHASNLGTGKIKKGKKMAGQTGNQRRTIRCQELVGVDAEHNMLLIKGAVPGPKNGYVIVRKSKTRS